VAHFKKQGDKAFASFSHVGEFTDRDLYVYVLSSEGVMLASGGASSIYIGRDMREYRDSDGKQPFEEMINGLHKDGTGTIEYRWLNLQHGKVEHKIAYYQSIDNRIIAVGYYLPRATPEQAKAMLWRAVDEMKRLGPQSFERFNDLNGGFVQDDTYVFVVGLKDRRMYAHGAIPRLVGQDVADLRDAKGAPIIREMIDIVNRNGEGTLDYQWRNPVTGEIEHKRTYLQGVGDYLVAVGCYLK
jgi:cytochrome c